MTLALAAPFALALILAALHLRDARRRRAARPRRPSIRLEGP